MATFALGWIGSSFSAGAQTTGRQEAQTFRTATDNRKIAPSPHEHMVTDPAAYSRYSRPGNCAQAGYRAYRYYWRGRDMGSDTILVTLGADSVPRPVQTVVRACLVRFTVESVPVSELASLVQAYAWSGQPELARAAANRLLTAKANRPAAERGEAIYRLLDAYIRPPSVWIEELPPLLAQYKALGAAAAIWSFRSHDLVMGRVMARDDFATAVALGEAAAATVPQMQRDERIDAGIAILNLYEMLAEATYYRSGPAAALARLDQAHKDITMFRDVTSSQYGFFENSLKNSRELYERIGETAQPIDAANWFNTHGDTAIRPSRGKVSLVFFVQGNCGASCYTAYTILRRLQAKYGSSPGFEIVLVGTTSGYFRSQLQPSIATEVEANRKYFVDYLKLPGVLAISETRFSVHADGRRFPEPDPNQQHYGKWGAIVVGKDGKFKYMTWPRSDTFTRLDRAIGEALK